MNILTTGGAVGLIIGISQSIKSIGINIKFIPLLNLLLGIAIFIGAHIFNISDTDNIGIAIMHGIICGLSASGLYSGVKNVSQGFAN